MDNEIFQEIVEEEIVEEEIVEENVAGVNIDFQYVENNKYKKEYEETGNLRKKGLYVLCEGHFMKWQRYNKGERSINWLCNWRVKNKHLCSASITIFENDKVKSYVGHDEMVGHPKPWEDITAWRVITLS